MDRIEINKLGSLQSMTVVIVADIERVIGWQYDRTDVVTNFAGFCVQSENIPWNVKALHLMRDIRTPGDVIRPPETTTITGDGGFEALVEILEKGYLNDICDIRLELGNKVTQQSMKRFCKLLQSGRLNDLQILHFHLCFFQQTTLCTFWEEFAKVLSSAHLSELKIIHTRGNKDEMEAGLEDAAGILANEFASGRLGSLRVLSLHNFHIGDEGMISLAEAFHSGHASELESLTLTSSGIGSAGTRSLAYALGSGHLRSLQILDLSTNSLGDEGVMSMAKSFHSGHARELVSLGLADNTIGEAGAKSLAEAFGSGNLGSLRLLDLSRNQLGDRSIMSLASSFRSGHVSKLESLTLRECKFGEAGTKSLADALGSGHLGSLQILDLSHNGSGDEGVVSLAKSFHSRHARKLQSIMLRSNGFGEAGTRSLADALRSGNLGSLRVLDYSANWLGDEGVVSLANAFQTGCASKLEFLDLGLNQIGDNGIKSLAAAFTSGKCSKLVFLNLHRNTFASEGLVALANAFKSGNLSDLEEVHLAQVAGSKTQTGIVEIAGALEAGSLPRLQMMAFNTGAQDSASLPADIKDALENSYRHNPYLIARISGLHGLTVDPWLRRMNNLLRSNEERAHRLKVLQYEEDVVGQHGKVFFCGDPRVGKTTLRITLSFEKATKRSGLMKKTRGLFPRSSPPEGPESTRGIEVTNVQSKGVTLALWDLAGQREYEVLHSAFMPDLNIAGGQATFFVIVCNAQDIEQAKVELEHWMRFISSNSVKDIKVDRRRRVFVVLNCFHRHRIPTHEIPRWRNFLTQCDKGFGTYLNLCKDPFIMNVRKQAEVQSFKSTILKEAKDILQSRMMPKICFSIQGWGREWVKTHENYPVLAWHEFRITLGALEEQKLEAAAEYLHEAGHIILFRKVISSAVKGDVFTSQGGLVIVDPEWFCKQVVGNLLLPEDIAIRDQDKLEIFQEEQGASLPISSLTEFKVPPDKIDQVVLILSRLGICYQIKDRPNDMFVPSLIKHEGMPGWSEGPWENDSGAEAWVMGFSLRVNDLTATLLPIKVLRKLQVDIALDKSIGERQDCNYLARKFSCSFKFEGTCVLIEFSPVKEDRIDVLVRPSEENLSRKAQINVAQQLVNRITGIAKDCARGVVLDRRIIQPWSVSQIWRPIEERNIKISAESLISRVRESGMLQMLEWKVKGKRVGVHDVLSDEDLFSFLDTISRKLELTKQAVNSLTDSKTLGKGEGTSSSESSSIDFAFANFKHQDADLQAVANHVCRYMEKLVGQVLENQRDMEERVHAHLVQLKEDVKGNINEILVQQRSLNLQFQNLETLSIEERELNVPRLAYVTKKGEQNLWMKLTGGMIVDTLVLRFLCEAKYETGGNDVIGRFHEVKHEDQEGIDVKKIPDWARKLSPLLAWTLKFVFVAAKIVGNVALPGFGILFGDNEGLSRILDKITQMAPGVADLSKYLFEGLDVAIKRSFPSTSGESVEGGSSSSSWVPGTEIQLRGGAKDALLKILDSMEDVEKKRQVGLQRVWLESSDRSGRKHIFWICNECYDRYMSHNPPRAHDV